MIDNFTVASIMKWYSISTNEMVRNLNSTVNSTLLHCFPTNFAMNNHLG